MTMEETDVGLMRRIKQGDAKAFELLVSRHERAVFNLALRFLNDHEEARDITQEAFVRVFTAAGTYVPTAKFTTWLYIIVRNLCFNSLRRRGAAAEVSLEDETLPEIPSARESPLDTITREEQRAMVIRAVRSLPEQMRFALILQKFHGLSCEEAAEVLGCSVNAVKLRVHRAKAILARELGGEPAGAKPERVPLVQ